MASDSQVPTNVFSISTILDGRLPPGGRLVAAAFDAVSGLASLQQSYRDISRVAGAQFLDHAVTRLGIGCDVTPEDLSRIPQSGPTVIVANHPFGGAEGLVLARVLLTVRPDVRVMGNRFLSLIPELRGLFIPVDPFGGSAAASRSIGGLRRAVEFLEGGGLLAVFPAGEVASLDLRRGTVDDPPWSATVVRLARRSGAAIVPVFFPGRNGATFQLAGLVHPMLRTALLPRQLLKQSGRSLTLAIGKPVLPASSAEAMSDEELIGALRGRTRLLTYVARNERSLRLAVFGSGLRIPFPPRRSAPRSSPCRRKRRSSRAGFPNPSICLPTPPPRLAEMAASYAAGIVLNHPFLDGNKRTGFMLAATFLELNGVEFTATEESVIAMTLALASGKLKQAAYAEWLGKNSGAR